MRLGLGTGSTVRCFLEALAVRIARGELADIVGVPTSVQTEQAAASMGIPLASLAAVKTLDLTVDGADEVAPGLSLIKGLGGALLREKIVAQASQRMLVIATKNKLVRCLGERAALPVEVVPFEFGSHFPWLASLGSEPQLRRGDHGEPYRTDNGNVIIDCQFPQGIAIPAELERALARRAGVVESGLFLGLASEAMISSSKGVERIPGCTQ